ncbi:MAG TPA: indole-3-glycerol-phosphate synthase [Nitrososphaera sp.]|nr:indole-3-glycerol-phosphate synthase [Nitrososphaera sp.]
MRKSAKTDFSLKRLVDNSYDAIDSGAYETNELSSHDAISLREAIGSCAHSPLITELKFSSPSEGRIRENEDPAKIAKVMVDSGAVGISVLTQPLLFNGSVEYLAAIRKGLPRISILMKDIIVSTVQIDAGKKIGADCVLLIKAVFDNNLAEDGMEKLLEYATKKGLEVLVEVHTGQEFGEVLSAKYDLIGINNRNLDNLDVDITNTEKLLKRYDKGKSVIISESGISSPEDIRYLKRVGADAFLVGTSIMQTSNIGAKICELYLAL